MLRLHGTSQLRLFPVLAALLASLALGHTAPQTVPPTAPTTEPSPKRYLFIVDTSVATEPRKSATLKAVQDLLKSGMGGQMREGDTLGVWTYNAQLYMGRLPLQRWSPGAQKAITSRSVAFLKSQKFELLPVFESILPALDGVIRNSHLITIILVTGGDGLMQGTPFDHRINDFWDRAREKQKAAKMPFIVVLRAQDGRLTDCSLNLAPDAVQMPPLPAETMEAAAPPQLAMPENLPKAQPPQVEPPVVSVPKSKPLQPPKAEETSAPRARPTAAVVTNEPAAPEPSPVTAQPAAKVETTKVEITPAKPSVPVSAPAPVSNAPPVLKAEQPNPTPAVTEAAKIEPEPAPPPKRASQLPPDRSPPLVPPASVPAEPDPKPVIAKSPVEQSVVAAPTQTLAQPTPAPPKPERAKALEPNKAQAAPGQVATTPLPPPPSMPPAKAIEAPKLAFGPKPTFDPASARTAATGNSAAVAPAVPSTETKTVQPTASSGPEGPNTSAAALSLASAPLKSASASKQKAELSAGPASSGEVALASSGTASNAARGLAPTTSTPSAPLASPGAPVQTATVAPAESFLRQKTAWIVGVLLAATACGFGWLASRRARTTPHGSLITRSLGRGKKP